MLIAWSVAFIALAFGVLVVFAVLALRSSVRLMRETKEGMEQMRQQLNGLSEESLGLIRTTSQTVELVRGHLKTAESLFDSVGKIGETVQYVTSSVTKVSTEMSDRAVEQLRQATVQQEKRFGEILEWAEFGFTIWQKWQMTRQTNAGSTTSSQNERRN